MVFTSIEFPIVFSLVLLLQHAVRRSALQTYVLLLASYLLYAAGSSAGTLLILTTSVVDYTVGARIHATEDASLRKRWLLVSLACNLGILGFFKYTNFLLQGASAFAGAVGIDLPVARYDLELPPGISYFTFTGVSYVLDVYYGRLDPSRRFAEYALHVAYFPKLLAGPIARAGEVLPQLEARVLATAVDFEVGLAYFLMGAVMKLAVADQVAGHVDLIFSAPGQFDGPTLLQGAVGYSVQIYCDFSGYSDMAIGCARMMGVRLPRNFAMPYSATSISEFWRRWHITLSSWFRDYVFLPLEIATRQSRFVRTRASFNLVLTMALCGLWHGASSTFVLWGCLHGIALAVDRTWGSGLVAAGRSGQTTIGRWLWRCFSRVSTLLVVAVGWVLFRSESWSAARVYLERVFTLSDDGMRMLSPHIIVAAALMLVLHALVHKDRNLAEELPQMAIPVRIVAFGALATIVFAFAATGSAPFLYSSF